MNLVARAGGHFDPKCVDIYRKELRRIKRTHGSLTTEVIVKEARARSSPLHDCFTWDNGRAAHLYRLNEAAHLCRYILVEVHQKDAKPETYALYYSVPSASGGREYVTIQEAKETKMNDYIIDAARAHLRRWQREYGRVKELSGIAKAIAEFLGS